tara:strand:- start:877 stop:1896 length:1020 start_codon:yes stop_codon:yes gene_type:complete
MKDLSNNSIDLLFCDLPYGQTSCKWDCLIDLDLFWKQINRICKDDCPMFFTCSTKFGVSLINSNPKNFRYDLVWVKSAPCGFLNAKKMPMKKHEMVYVFYKKLPKVYTDNIAEHHTHKFLDTKNGMKGQDDIVYGSAVKQVQNKQYDPPLPTSIIRDDNLCNYDVNKNAYGGGKEGRIKISKDKREHETRYEPPLPTSIIKTELYSSQNKVVPRELYRNQGGQYEPPLPNSVIKTEHETAYGSNKHTHCPQQRNGESIYDPPLPNSLLEIKSERGKHATQKPTELIKWCLKYYSKEGDTVLDPTMGSGSTGVACKEMNRNFIGIEMDKTIYDNAVKRLA